MPRGLVATVRGGFADLKIRNDSPMPVKIQAEESDGYVRISILGTETRDYDVEMSYTVGGRYVRTYMSKIDKETGEVISKEPYALSGYMDDIYSFLQERSKAAPVFLWGTIVKISLICTFSLDGLVYS